VEIQQYGKSLIPQTSTHVFIFLSKIERQGEINHIIPIFIYPYQSEMILDRLQKKTPVLQNFNQYINKPFMFTDQELVWHNLAFSCPPQQHHPNWMVSLVFLPYSEEALKCAHPVTSYLYVIKEIVRENLAEKQYALSKEDIEEEYLELKDFITEFLNTGIYY